MGTATAYNSGAMSHKAYNATLAKTRPQNSKMAKFEGKGRKDEGGVRDMGEVPGNEINHHTNQHKTRPLGNKLGPPVQMKGGRDRGGQPTGAHIDREQGPAFAGSGQSTKGTATVDGTAFSRAGNKLGRGFKGARGPAPATGNTAMRGKMIGAGGRYGDGNSRSGSSY